MDESGTLPSDPSPISDDSNREATPEPVAPSPTEGTTGESAPPALPSDRATAGSAPPDEAAAAAEQERLAKENAQRLEREIESLRTGRLGDARREFHTLFEQEQRLHALFRQTSPLRERDRHRLWNALKQAGAEVRQAHQQEWESRRYQSIEACETIEEKLREVEALAQGTPGAEGFHRAESLLNEVRARLGSDAPDSPGRTLVGPDRRACWNRWRKVRDALRLVRGAQQEQDYQALAATVAEVNECARSGDAYEAIRLVKELQARLGQAYLRRGQFEDLRRRLSEAWQAAQTRISEQRRERSARRDEWRTRMAGHVARWRGTLEQRRAQREHLIQQVARLEGMEQSARSEALAAQARGWLQETLERLRRTEESIAELDERIRTTAKKLGGRSTGTLAGEGGTTPPEPPADPGDEERSETPRDEPPGPPEAGS